MAQARRLRKDLSYQSYTGEGVPELLEFLKEDGDVLPWEEAKKQEDQYI